MPEAPKPIPASIPVVVIRVPLTEPIATPPTVPTAVVVTAVVVIVPNTVAVAAAPAAAAPAEDADAEVSVVLASVPADKKIAVLKEVRTLTGLGLKEAKDLVEAAPKAVKENIKKEEAAEIKKTLEAAGAVVEIK